MNLLQKSNLLPSLTVRSLRFHLSDPCTNQKKSKYQQEEIKKHKAEDNKPWCQGNDGENCIVPSWEETAPVCCALMLQSPKAGF